MWRLCAGHGDGNPAGWRRWKRLFGIASIGSVLGLALLVGLGLYLDHFGQVERAQSAQAIVVLGARVVAPGVPGDSLRTRTLKAVELFNEGMAPVIICTGGVGDVPPAEAVAAKTLAVAQGVPASCILLEDRSASTAENIRNTAAICRENGWTCVIAVSDPYHLWRVKRGFARRGITAYPSPARNCRRNREPLLRLEWTTRETLAVVRDVLTGQ